MSGYKEWSREVSTDAGTEARLNATLEKVESAATESKSVEEKKPAEENKSEPNQ